MALIRTPQFDDALRLMESGGVFTFITGRAGTGKSTLLKHFRETTKLLAPVLAPTGVAALNVEGETIHRFFGFAPGITIKEARRKASAARDLELYRNADLLIIDEISMVRADLIDCMDQFLRAVRKNKSPFGGLRIVAIGDLYQLPPVISTQEKAAFSQLYPSPYFFAANVMRQLIDTGEVSFLELETVYRQTDPSFIALLNAVRDKNISGEELCCLNDRVCSTVSKETIVLTAVNAAADRLNDMRLHELSGTPRLFKGEVRGNFPEREAPVPAELRLKIGARVMCVANDPGGQFVNGSLGWVTGFERDAEGKTSVIVKLDDGGQISVSSHAWSVYRSIYDRDSQTLDQEKLGSFTQIPLKLAWAVTIHKSQGKTFDQVAIDFGRGAFAAGQAYVALSRCRSLEGINLVNPLSHADIHLDPTMINFMQKMRNPSSRKQLSLPNE